MPGILIAWHAREPVGIPRRVPVRLRHSRAVSGWRASARAVATARDEIVATGVPGSLGESRPIRAVGRLSARRLVEN